jgi:hypothetical protein
MIIPYVKQIMTEPNGAESEEDRIIVLNLMKPLEFIGGK